MVISLLKHCPWLQTNVLIVVHIKYKSAYYLSASHCHELMLLTLHGEMK